MIAAFDVHYEKDQRASAAVVLFRSYADARPAGERVLKAEGVLPYIPGQFYRRELPFILGLIKEMDRLPEEIIVDGYAVIGDRPGLGQHLFESLNGTVAVIGVAKSRLKDAPAIEVFRGGSKRPLYVTTAGIDAREAAERITRMHGLYRLPTLLKYADMLARGKCDTDKRNVQVHRGF